jgi:hypothetical protein
LVDREVWPLAAQRHRVNPADGFEPCSRFGQSLLRLVVAPDPLA